MKRNVQDLHHWHLEDDDIELLGWLGQGGEQPEAGTTDVGRLREHLSACESCREEVWARGEEMASIRRKLAESRAVPGPDCPPASIWPLVAIGLSPVEHAAEHAARCPHCGQLLQEATADVESDVTAEETAATAALPSSRPGMASQIARRLEAGLATQERVVAIGHSKERFRNWWLAAAACLAVAAMASYWHYMSLMRNPETVLAQEYTANRMLEWRFRGAARGPLRVNRGVPSSQSLPTSPKILRLEARIAEQLMAHPDDPYWLTSRGHLNLLAWRYEAALKDYSRVLDSQPESADAMTDLAGAYFERAEATGHDLDYGTAIELLSKALQKRPNDSVALFNRGLASERMYLYGRAVADWEQLSKLEPGGSWAEELRSRLAEAKKKVQGQ